MIPFQVPAPFRRARGVSRPQRPAAVTFGTPVVVARDQQTLEVRQFYPLPTVREETLSYSMDAYFFFPRSFAISPTTWPKEIFYRNTNILSRLHAQGLSLQILKDVGHPDNPATLLLRSLAGMTAERSASGTAMTALAQIYGAELSEAIRSETKALAHLLRARGGDPAAAQVSQQVYTAADALATHCLEVLSALRRVRVTAQAFVAIVPPSLLACLQFAEEYIAAVIDERLSDLALQMGRSRALCDGSCLSVASRARLAQALEELNCRRTALGYVRARGTGQKDGEYYSYRLSLLKKELQRSLYINTRALSTDPFYANSAAIVGSGLAATWATLAQIPAISGVFGGSARSLLVASTLAIVVYVLKDRLKEWAQKRLRKRWSRWDHDIVIEGNTLADVGLGAFKGAAKESFRWEDEGSLSPEIAQMRQRQRTVRGASSELEQVFHYRRTLSLAPVAASPLPPGYGIEEMLRLNLDDVLRRLDDPNQTVSFYRGGGTFEAALMPKVYHLNVVTVVHSSRDQQRFITRHRVVLNKNRILRIELVN
jgi:hypothetical protein